MKEISKQKKLIFTLALILLSIFNCKKEVKYYRLIDHLDKNNIVYSPLTDLETNFDKAEQEWKREQMHPFLIGKTRFQGITTTYPILGTVDSDAPKHMKVFKDGKELPYLDNQKFEKQGWKWIKCEKIIQIQRNFYRKELFNGKTFYTTDINLPEGETMFEVRIINDYPESFSPRIKIALDDNIIGNIRITDSQHYRIYKKVHIGNHRLGLIFEKIPDSSDGNNEKISIHVISVKIKCPNDLILVYDSERNKSSNTTFKANYSKEPTVLVVDKNKKRFGIPNPTLRELYYLYFFNTNRALILNDVGVNTNPHNIKKKIASGDTTLNILFAPTPSNLRFEVKVPENGLFEFGYGMRSPPWDRKRTKLVNFELVIEKDGKKDVIFSKDINGNIDAFSTEKVSLSSYSKKKITIFLKTFHLDKKEHNISYAYWYNPIIYQPAEEREKINIILISLDSLRADHLGCYGYQKDTSPNINKLAEDSVLFTNCFSQASQTLVSHMSMLTSLFPVNHQVYSFLRTNPFLISIADLLRTKQYFTGAYTGGGQVSATLGFSKGFDFYNESREKLSQKDSPPELFKKTAAWINRNQEKDFFLFLHTYEIHDPYAPPKNYAEKFLDEQAKWKSVYMFELTGQSKQKYRHFSDEEKQNIIALYDGEIAYTDDRLIKPLIRELKKLNLYDRTMIIITSDHGQEFYEHGGWLHTHSVYNELIKVPLIIKFPHSKYKGTKIQNFVRSVDIAPTILKEVDIEFSNHDLDGRSLMPLIKGKEKGNRIFFSEVRGYAKIFPPQTATNKNGYKIIFNELGKTPQSYFDPPPPLKDEVELYFLENDPEEINTIAEAKKELTRELLDTIIKYLQQSKMGKDKLREIIIDDDLREKLKALGYIR